MSVLVADLQPRQLADPRTTLARQREKTLGRPERKLIYCSRTVPEIEKALAELQRLMEYRLVTSPTRPSQARHPAPSQALLHRRSTRHLSLIILKSSQSARSAR